MTAALDLFHTFVHLRADGSAAPEEWRPDFWQTTVIGEGDRLVGAIHGAKREAFHPDMAEMHPRGDEVLHLVTGALDVILEERDGERIERLRGGQTCIVPRGVWHRLVVHEPSDLLFITPAGGTQHRPAPAP
jgi:mannose-6-phosphate isomerase-like protein (cupin superfamily)